MTSPDASIRRSEALSSAIVMVVAARTTADDDVGETSANRLDPSNP